MSVRYLIVLVFFVVSYSYGQVGIGTTNPSASLDIQSSSQTTPSNTDGLLIPKIDEFPASNPGANQDGMLVYASGNGTPSKGFYYWDNATTSWVFLIEKNYGDTNYLGTNPSGLELITEAGFTGYRLIGRDPSYFDNIGFEAVDLSFSLGPCSNCGASGNYSFTTGFETRAIGDYSFAANNSTFATGNMSSTFGLFTNASAYISSAFGRFNENLGGSASSWVDTDPLFQIGNGASDSSRSDALTILKNGTITAPSLDISEIIDNKALITKEYADANYSDVLVETDPKVGTLVTGYVPRWNGTTLEDGAIFNSGTNVGIGTVTPTKALDVRSGVQNTAPTWISGVFGPTNVGNRVVVGNLNGNATIGSHNNALNAWADLYLNTGGRVEIPYVLDASSAAGSGSLEIGNALRIDDNEIITNTNAVLYLNNNNNGDVIIDNNSLMVDASANKVGIGTGTPGAIITNSKLDVVGGHVAVSNNFGVLSFNSASNSYGAGFDTTTTDDLHLYAGGANRLIVTNSGNVSAPSFSMEGIVTTGNKALITKEYADANYIDAIFSGDYNDLTNLPTLFSGDYNDLTNQPTITNPTGLETINEGNGLGWRLIGRNPVNYGNIGLNAVDHSHSNSASGTRGATGENSAAMGLNTEASGINALAIGNGTIASGDYSVALGAGTNASVIHATAMGLSTQASGITSTAMGRNTIASGDNSTTMGLDTEASGVNSVAMGNQTEATASYSTTLGRYNVGGGNTTTWVATDPLFEIGNGAIWARSNALTVLKNGTITAPSFDISEITNNKALITKEYADANYLGTNPTGLETINEGNGIGWRLIGRNPANFGNIGFNAVDLSQSFINGTTVGAKGLGSFSMGYDNNVNGVTSYALGHTNYTSGFSAGAFGTLCRAVGDFSIAMGYYVNANSYGATAVGLFNVGLGVSDTRISTDPIFEVGNGLSVSSRSNALTVLKNGNVGIGTHTPTNRLEVTGGNMQIDGGTLFVDASSNKVGISTNSPGAIITNSKLDVIGGHVAVSNNYGVLSFNSANTGIGAGFDTTGSDGLDLYAGGANRVNVLANGDFRVDNTTLVVDESADNVGIGTGTPSTKLHIFGANDASLANGSGIMVVGDESSLNIVFDRNEIMARDNGAASPLYLQQNGGAVYVNGAVVHASDRRLKTNIEDLNYGLAEILKLQPKAYHWKNRPQNKKSLGLIAQDDVGLGNEIFVYGKQIDDFHTVDYDAISMLNVSATQEQQKRIEQQQKEIEALKLKLQNFETLSRRMEKIEAQLTPTNQ